MTPKTGNPRGRPPGSKNKFTRQIEHGAKQARVIAKAVPDAFAGDAHAFLTMVYKDPTRPIELRIEAAKAAVKYEKPALATIDVTSTNEHFVHDVSDKPADRDGDAWLAQHAAPH